MCLENSNVSPFIDLLVMTLITISQRDHCIGVVQSLGGFWSTTSSSLFCCLPLLLGHSFNHRKKKLQFNVFDKNVRLNLIMAWFKLQGFFF